MNTKVILLALALGASTCLLSAQDNPPPPDKDQPAKAVGAADVGGERHDHPGGPGQAGYHLLPPNAMHRLNLTDAQKKQIVALEADVRTKLKGILTADQMKQLEQMRPPRPMRGGPGDEENDRGMRGGPGGPEGHGGPEDHAGPPPADSDK